MVILKRSFLFHFIWFLPRILALMTMQVPLVIKTDQFVTVSWTRAATDPVKFIVNVLEGNGAPFFGGLPVTANDISGVFTFPPLSGVPPGVYLVEAVNSTNPSDVLGSSNKFTIVPASPTGSAIGSTSRNNGPPSTSVKPGSTPTTTETKTETLVSEPASSSITAARSPVSVLSSTSISDSRISFHTSGLPSSFRETPTTSSISPTISTTSPPSSHSNHSRPSLAKFILIGVAVALLLMFSSLIILCVIRRRRRRRHQQLDQETPFTLEPVSQPWFPGKVLHPFISSSDSGNSSSSSSRQKPGITRLDTRNNHSAAESLTESLSGRRPAAQQEPAVDVSNSDSQATIALPPGDRELEIQRLEERIQILREEEAAPPAYRSESSSITGHDHSSFAALRTV
ncbi:hypothetical protein C8J56DRAFT_1169194 [Mycena floridula]|nr:hypothetical protein C8J56DRAFT_1169194 [Mycena floridula]